MTRLYQLETDFTRVNCGMSYAVALEDGRFILIDGGYFGEGEAEALYAFLCAHSAGRPRIAAWFFTHAHQDHVGAYINFIRKYARMAQIEALYYNFHPVDYADISGDWMSSDPATVREFYRASAECLPEARTHKLVTGEMYDFNDVSIEVLYTYEDMGGATSTFNDHSAVFALNCLGQRVLFLGDIFKEGSRALLRKPDKLKCDVVQVAHHGFSGATEEVYRATGAFTALWPTKRAELDANAHRPANAYLMNESGMEHIISNDGTAELRLPYTKGSYIRLARVF